MNPVKWAQRVTGPDSGLSANAVTVALAIAVHATNSRTPSSRCSNAAVQRWTRLSESTVHRAFRELHAQGWVVTVREKTKHGADAAPMRLLIVPEPVDNTNPEPVDNTTGGGLTDTRGVSHRHPTGVSHRHPLKEKVSTKEEPPPEPVHNPPAPRRTIDRYAAAFGAMP